MGYHTDKSSMITIPSSTAQYITIPQAAAADQTLPSIVIPDYRGTCIAAYLRYIVSFFDQATAASATDGTQYIQIDNSDGTGYHNAITIPNGSIGTSGALMFSMPIFIQGNTDISTYCGKGKTLAIKWAMAKMTAGVQQHRVTHLELDLIIQ